MLRFLIRLGAIFVWTQVARADQIVSAGQVGALVVHNLSQGSQEGPLFELTAGYGSGSNTIGDGIWFSGPGVFDLSGDPDFPGFLSCAQNGVGEPVTITAGEKDGPVDSYHFYGSSWEFYWFGGWPDLVSYEVTGSRLQIFDVQVDNQSPSGGNALIVAQWQFLSVPEPSMILYMCAWIVTMSLRRGGPPGTRV